MLIGGIYKKVTGKDASGYPWLYKIPVVSFLFGVKDSAKNMVESVFLITPRIVEVSSKNLGDYSEYFKPAPLVEDAINIEQSSSALPTEEIKGMSNKGWITSTNEATPLTPISSSRNSTGRGSATRGVSSPGNDSGKNSVKQNSHLTFPSKQSAQQAPSPTPTPKPKSKKSPSYDPPLKLSKQQLNMDD